MIDKKIARAGDILEQIKKLDNLLELLEQNKGDASSIQQYEYMRNEFVKELGQIFIEFKLKIVPIEMAA